MTGRLQSKDTGCIVPRVAPMLCIESHMLGMIIIRLGTSAYIWKLLSMLQPISSLADGINTVIIHRQSSNSFCVLHKVI